MSGTDSAGAPLFPLFRGPRRAGDQVHRRAVPADNQQFQPLPQPTEIGRAHV